jgi:CO/xanthine dehydrogenase FAD-binding subunit
MSIDVQPATWAQAVADAADPSAVVVAGGTGVQPWLTTTGVNPTALVHLSKIPEAWTVDPAAERLRLGAMVSVGHAALTDWLGEHGPLWFATPAIRRRATLVGNVVSPLGPRELAPIVVAVDGRVSLMSQQAQVWQPVQDVLELAPGTLAAEITVARPERISYRRVAPRTRLARVEMGLCAALGPECGAALVLTVGGRVHRIPEFHSGSRRGDFVESVRAAAAQQGAADVDLLTVLADQVHRDLHGGVVG